MGEVNVWSANADSAILVANTLGVTRVDFISTTGQTVFGLPAGVAYTVGTNSMLVYVNGILQEVGTLEDYKETSNVTFTFNSALPAGEKVTCLIGQFINTLESLAASAILLANTNTIQTYVGNRSLNLLDAPYSILGGAANAAANAAALELAVSAVYASGSKTGTIVVPAGNWYMTRLDFSTLATVEINIFGDQRLNTSINFTETTGAMVDLTNSRFFNFRRLNIINQTAKNTSGELFDLDNADDCEFEHLRISSFYDGFVFRNGASGHKLTDVQFITYSTYTWNWPIRSIGANSNIRLSDVTYQESNVCTGGFIKLEKVVTSGVDTFRVFRCSAQKQSSGLIPYGLLIEAGEFVNVLQSNFECGSASARGIKLEGGTNVHIFDSHCVSNLIGLESDNVDGLEVVGGRYYFNQQEGLKFNKGTDISLLGVDVFDNSQAAANTYDGINADNANVIDFSAVGCHVGGIRGTVVKLKNGINIKSVSGSAVVTGNTLDLTYINEKAVLHSFGKADAAKNNIIIETNAGESEAVLTAHARLRTTNAAQQTLWSYTLNDNEHLQIEAIVIYQGSSGTASGSFKLSTTVYRDGGAAVIEAAKSTASTLTDSTGGTADTTLAAVSGSGDDATINNNFADLAAQLNNLIVDIKKANLFAEHNAAVDCIFDVSADDVRIRPTGLVGNTFDWHCHVRVFGKLSAA